MVILSLVILAIAPALAAVQLSSGEKFMGWVAVICAIINFLIVLGHLLQL